MRLQSFEVLPRGERGWGSGLLRFGERTTLLLGANGAGKTPLMHALAHALGQPVAIPPQVLEQCVGARLVLEADGRRITVERSFDTKASVVDDGSARRLVENEKDLSALLLPALGMPLRTLMGKNDRPSPPYLSTIGPLFVVDQDIGWANSYVAHEAHNFVKDQREEAVRWALDLPPRHRVVDKDDFEDAQVKLGSLQQQVTIVRDALSDLDSSLGEDRSPDAETRLRSQKVLLEAQFQSAFSVIREDATSVDEETTAAANLETARRDLVFRLNNLKRRREQLQKVQVEVGAEMEALEQNETAAETFRAYCGHVACQLFRRPDESYGRRVLYLKDQMKDFSSNQSEVERSIGLLEEQVVGLNADLERIRANRQSRQTASGAIAALERLHGLTNEIALVSSRIDDIERVKRHRETLETLLKQEQRAAELVENLRPSRGPRRDQGRSLDARVKLAAHFREWMTILKTPNVSGEIEVDENLQFRIDSEVFRVGSSQSGSTRARLVLAAHAAILDTSIQMNGNHPLLLILDAPRQHELNASHLRDFVQHFFMKASTKWATSPQLIFSATDPDVIPDGCIDVRWEPSFAFGDQLRFLGPGAS